MDKRLHLLESFKARADDGTVYVVRGYEHLARFDGAPDVDSAWQPTGVAEYRLENGDPVAVDRSGTMTIVGSGIKLSRESEASTA